MNPPVAKFSLFEKIYEGISPFELEMSEKDLRVAGELREPQMDAIPPSDLTLLARKSKCSGSFHS